MAQPRPTRCVIQSWLTLLAFLVFLSSEVQASSPSPLSTWLSGKAIPELRELLSQHPRYKGRSVQIVSEGDDALSEALAIVLKSGLAQRSDILLVSASQTQQKYPEVPGSIDELDCHALRRSDLLLQVLAARSESGSGRVRLQLLELHAPEESPRGWYWRGTFKAAERVYLTKPAATRTADGSLSAPWNEKDVERAAFALVRNFACALRPQVRTHLNLEWAEHHNLPTLFADTSNVSRHLLGNYRELGVTGHRADYLVDIGLKRLRHDTWQVWLTGTPSSKGLTPVQAVTYFEAGDLNWPSPPSAVAVTKPQSAALVAIAPQPPAPPPNRGPALEFIEVEMLDATQSDNGSASADLQVRVRIANRADWPIEYSFTLSGGHFNHCIARADYYRHDRYGFIEGRIDAGENVVRRLTIEDTQHRPNPWLGQRKCAGFRDLEGFEQFASKGYKVTEFVRWGS